MLALAPSFSLELQAHNTDIVDLYISNALIIYTCSTRSVCSISKVIVVSYWLWEGPFSSWSERFGM